MLIIVISLSLSHWSVMIIIWLLFTSSIPLFHLIIVPSFISFSPQGTVSFDKNERPGLITFSQFQAHQESRSEVVIASYDALEDKLDFEVGFPIFWRGSSPPIDYTIQLVTPFRINRTVFIVISILAIFGIILAIIFLTINIKFRNQRWAMASRSNWLNDSHFCHL